MNHRDLREVLRKRLASGVEFRNQELQKCEVCLPGKMSSLPFPKKSQRSTKILEIVHSDVWGPARVESLGRARYFVTFIDDYSRWCEIRVLRQKSDVLQAFRDFKVQIEIQTGQKIKCLMSDNGREYCNVEFDKFLRENGIKRRLTVTHTPQQNGVAERKNRTLMEMARCLLLQSWLSKMFWAEAIVTANYLRNRCPTSSLDGHTPFEFMKKEIPMLSHLRIFGSRVYVLNKDPTKGKLEARSRLGMMVGYSDESKGYRVWIPEIRKITIARDVEFLEGVGECNESQSRTKQSSEDIKDKDIFTLENEDTDKITMIVDAPSQGSGNNDAVENGSSGPTEPYSR